MGEVSTLSENLFVGGGEMGALMRSRDWSQTPLGAVETWPQSLRTIVPLVLNSRFPMVIWWGKELVLLYNDAWQPILGTKHPKALGRPGQEVWLEIWDIIGVQLESVLETAQATWSDDMLLLVDRYGYTEEAFFTYSYSPIFLETGEVGGAFTAVTETTRRVIGERRLRTLRELAASTGEAKSVEETCRMACATLANNPYDISFGLLYLVEQEGQQARLVETVRIDAGTPAGPKLVDLATEGDCWKFAQVKKTGDAEIIDELITRFGMLSGGAWDEPSKQAIVLPIAMAGQKQLLAGFLVLGISPRRAFDDEYRSFFDLVASNIATEIANAQAYEAERKRAEALAELDRAKTTFFSNVSHEFRTPLTLMLSPLEEVIANLDGTIPPQESEQLLLVQRNGIRLLKLVNSLLDFSRIEAGRVQAAYEPVDLATYTAELASTFRSLIERAGMSLIVDFPPLPEAIYVDRGMWEKIVLNLLSNAFKFTLSGSITVRLQWVDSHVKLSVADTGVGIPAEELPHLFERFHRVENSQGRSFEGSGIGLSLVQELVKLHGGAIAVSSTFGQGSCFTVTIPAGTAHLPPERIRASCTLASTALGAIPYVEEAQRWLPEGDFRLPIVDFELDNNPTNLNLAPANRAAQSKILLADDNADMRDYIRRLLSGSYTVETVADGVAALTAIENNPPDLVLSDVMMPFMDGFELLRSLRSNPITQDIPIILLSARAGEESRIEGLAAGADDYLIKPFSARELLARVEASLKLARLRQEATVRERTILGRITDAFMALDLDFRFTYANVAAQRVTQTPLEAMLGKTLWECFPGTVGAQFEFQYRRSLSEQVAVDFEEYYPPLDLWVEVHVYPSPTGLSLFFRDINDRKRIEGALRQSEERYRTLFESIDEGFCIIEVLFDANDTPIDYRFLEINPVFEQQTGLQQAVGKTVRQLVPNFEDHWIKIYGQVALTGEAVRFENASEALNRWFDVYACRTGQPEARKVAVVFKDISDRKRIEAEREQLLQREQTAREAAERANRIKDEFLAVLSHELRSPLNPILGWSNLLQRGNLDATKTATALATIERNARLQSQLIDDLLDISRILSGKLTLNAMSVDLNMVISAALETVRLAAEAKSVQIQTTFLPSPGMVIGDSGRLQQVIWNLLSNAVKFTPQGGQITVRLTQSGTHAQIQVSDTGKGINPEFLPYVFEHFRQEDGATTRKFGGLGLGLAIVRQVVEMHGGTVTADSPGIGLGATFTVQIPLAPRLIESPTLDPSPIRDSDLSGIHILVVDDETDSREFVAFVLEQAGAIVTTVASGIDALRAFSQSVPNIIVSDIGMPVMDGYMLMRQIRALPEGKQIPAIALTAYAGELDRQQAEAAGFQRHVAKPIEPEVVVAIVVELLSSV
ncbi:response regulator [Trichocoleus sp. FACHB-832]|uniref:ATP-binding protein n=1 Tax=Trichocoleus sp. FACHB-832 TaxID=2692875 RepID=UPI0016825758|nr:ATP-binding protein [Trichocoleus sp. FACHB-832]MBD1906275.1 response regulator [Trichocoleus sp. FACHB-832]